MANGTYAQGILFRDGAVELIQQQCELFSLFFRAFLLVSHKYLSQVAGAATGVLRRDVRHTERKCSGKAGDVAHLFGFLQIVSGGDEWDKDDFPQSVMFLPKKNRSALGVVMPTGGRKACEIRSDLIHTKQHQKLLIIIGLHVLDHFNIPVGMAGE